MKHPHQNAIEVFRNVSFFKTFLTSWKGVAAPCQIIKTALYGCWHVPIDFKYSFYCKEKDVLNEKLSNRVYRIKRRKMVVKNFVEILFSILYFLTLFFIYPLYSVNTYGAYLIKIRTHMYLQFNMFYDK